MSDQSCIIRNCGLCHVLAGASVLALLAPGLALAQEADDGAIKEIVVTAQKRAQRLEDVPVAVSAVTSETVEQRRINDINDLTKVAPSLTVTQSNSRENNSINLRGIGTYAFSPGVESAVAVIVDDVPLLQQAQAFTNLSDVEQIEVLRGPQGTLFGKNASAGVVNIVTKASSNTVTASASGTVTSDAEYRGQASLSGPLAEGVGIRVSGYYDYREGNIQNLQTGHFLNGEESFGVRARLDLHPTDTLKLVATVSHSWLKTNGQARTFREVPSGVTIAAGPARLSVAPSLVGIVPGEDNYSIRLNDEPWERDRQTIGSFKGTLDLGAVSLVSVSSYQDWRYKSFQDNDGTIAASNTASAQTHAHNFTQELRLVSTPGKPVDYLIGLFYSDGSTTRAFQRLTPASNWIADAGLKSYAGFGQATLHITPHTHVDAGARLNQQEIAVNFRNLSNAGAVTTSYAGQSGETAFVYKIALRQDLAPGTMVYASYATGYKGQAYDISTGFNQARVDSPAKRESSRAYEIGLKGRFLDNHLQTNLALFLTDYDQFQAQSTILVDGVPQFILNNVGKLRSKGVEFDGVAAPRRDLQIAFGGAYTDAKIISFPNAPCFVGQTSAQGCVGALQNLSGSALSNSPKFKYYVAANYTLRLTGAPFDVLASADWQHQSSVNYDLLGSPRAFQEGYGVMNASLGVRSHDGRYQLMGFVNNVFDRHYAASIGNAFGSWDPVASTPSAQVLPRNSQRYFGLKLTVKN